MSSDTGIIDTSRVGRATDREHRLAGLTPRFRLRERIILAVYRNERNLLHNLGQTIKCKTFHFYFDGTGLVDTFSMGCATSWEHDLAVVIWMMWSRVRG